MSHLEFDCSRNGLPIAKIDGKYQQSRFDPVKEAARFVSSKVNLEEKRYSRSGQLVIFGETMGYLLKTAFEEGFRNFVLIIPDPVFKEKISLMVEQLAPAGLRNCRILSASLPSTTFFESHFYENETELRILAWEPALMVSQELKQLLHEFPVWLRRKEASLATGRFFARRWLRNSIINCMNLKKTGMLMPTTSPVLITAGGPGLRESIPFIRKNRSRFHLLALTSSLQTLQESQIAPDIVMQTDAGYWATRLIAPVIKQGNRGKESPVPILMPLTAAALPVYFRNEVSGPLMILDQQSLIDQSLETRKMAAFSIPECGTVAASALLCALQWSSAPVIFAGLDLDSRSELHHVSSHLSIDYIRWGENRLNPLQNNLFAEKQMTPPGGALQIFREWFSQAAKEHPRFFRLSPVVSKIPENTISTEDAEKLLPIQSEKVSIEVKEKADRKGYYSKEALLQWLSHLQSDQNENIGVDDLSGDLFKGLNPESARSELLTIIKGLEALAEAHSDL